MKLPSELEVWCCPSEQDFRTQVYLDGAMNSDQDLVYVYRRCSNDDEYSPRFYSPTDALDWIENSDAECKPIANN